MERDRERKERRIPVREKDNKIINIDPYVPI